jgi:hypothetical protein
LAATSAEATAPTAETAAASSTKAASAPTGAAETTASALSAEAALLVKAAGAALLEVRIAGTAGTAKAGTAFVGIASDLLEIPAQRSIQKEGFIGSVTLDTRRRRSVAG